MTRTLFLVCMPIALAGAAACNGDRSSGAGSYDGTYMLTSHTRNDTGCNAAGAPVTDGATYFRLEQDTFFGQPLLGWHDCETPDTCDDSISLTGSFVTIDGEWRMRSSYSSGGTECLVGMTDGTITETADGVRIEIRRYNGTVTVPTEDDCMPEVAEENMSELQCDELEVMEAVQI